MKTKKLQKKLSLSKETVSTLDFSEQDYIVGGKATIWPQKTCAFSCIAQVSCVIYSCGACSESDCTVYLEYC